MLKRTLRQAMLLPLVLVGLARSATATRGSLSDEIQRILDVSADATGFAFSAGCVHAVCVLIITLQHAHSENCTDYSPLVRRLLTHHQTV